MKAHLLLPFAFAITVSGSALAQDKVAISKDLHGYYEGERVSAYVVASLGLSSVVGGSVLVTQSTDFERGLGVPLIALGALEGIGAIVYAFQVGAEIRHHASTLDHDAAAYRREELAHMHGTSSRFVFYRLTELGLALGGVAVASYGFAANADAWKGAGIGITSIMLPFLVIDTINNGRATSYSDHVRSFDPPPPTNVVAPIASTSSTPFYLSYSGRF